MKLSKAIRYFFILLSGYPVFAMEQQKIQKINGENFYSITQSRTIPSLKQLSLLALSDHISQVIKHDPTYTVTKFNEFLTALSTHINPESLTSLMHENIENQWIKNNAHHNRSRINKLHFSNNYVVWHDCNDIVIHGMPTNDTEQPPIPLVFDYFLSQRPIFAFTNSVLGIVQDETEIALYNKYLNEWQLPTIPTKNSSDLTAIAFDHQKMHCAIGDINGKVFIISPTNATHKVLKKKFTHTITHLYFSPHSQLFACDSSGTNYICDGNEEYALPFKKKISAGVSSADNAFIALQHADNNNKASLLDWNNLTITELCLGKIVAITAGQKIIAYKKGSLLTYTTKGQLLRTTRLPKTAKLYSNEMPTALLALPLYLMTTTKKITMNDNFTSDSEKESENNPQKDSRDHQVKEKIISTTFFLPQQLSINELFEKISGT